MAKHVLREQALSLEGGDFLTGELEVAEEVEPTLVALVPSRRSSHFLKEMISADLVEQSLDELGGSAEIDPADCAWNSPS